MRVIDLVADAPAHHAGMIAVSAHPAGHIPRLPLREKACIVIGRLRAAPHIEGLHQKQNALLIRDLQQIRGRHVMGSTDGVDSHLLQDQDLALHRIVAVRTAERPQVMVLTDTVQLQMMPVQEKSAVGRKDKAAETEIGRKTVQHPLALLKGKSDHVKSRMLGGPKLGMLDRNTDFGKNRLFSLRSPGKGFLGALHHGILQRTHALGQRKADIDVKLGHL